jgi:hypothetical protein
MRGRPPRLLERALSIVSHGSSRDAVLGDLHVEFVRIESVRGRGAAVRWYAGQVLGAIVPGVRRRLSSGSGERGDLRGGGSARAKFDVFVTDVSHATRSLVRRPLHAAGAILTLALAIGANSATFGMIDAILLRPLTYPDGDRIVSLAETHPDRQSEWGWVSIPNLADWRSQSGAFESVALFRAGSMAVTGGGEPAYVIGQTLMLDGSPRTITGVMPAGYDAGGDWIGRSIDLWVPFDFIATDRERSDRSYNAAARVTTGVTLADAASELSLIDARLEAEYP